MEAEAVSNGSEFQAEMALGKKLNNIKTGHSTTEATLIRLSLAMVSS